MFRGEIKAKGTTKNTEGKYEQPMSGGLNWAARSWPFISMNLTGNNTEGYDDEEQ